MIYEVNFAERNCLLITFCHPTTVLGFFLRSGAEKGKVFHLVYSTERNYRKKKTTHYIFNKSSETRLIFKKIELDCFILVAF